MSDDSIIKFPGSRKPIPKQAAVRDRLAQQEQDRAERKRQLERTLRQNQWFRRRSDVISPAQALNDLLVRIKKDHGHPIAEILGTPGSPPVNKRITRSAESPSGKA